MAGFVPIRPDSAFVTNRAAMYSTCLFCNETLGENQVVEHFQVGRRLAYDLHRGRLWVVCRRCERWNLSPLEERWEAMEECEEIFRSLRTRVSSENVGLARHPEGLELVRIGEPLRPEFAAWRYGDQFGRRRKKAILMGAGAAAVLGTAVLAGLVTGVISGVLAGQTGNFINLYRATKTVVRVPEPNGRVLKLKATDLDHLRVLSAGAPDEWSLGIKRGKTNRVWEGEDALGLAAKVLPAINRAGAGKSTVQDAVTVIEDAGDPSRFLHRLSPELGREEGNLWKAPIGSDQWRPMKETKAGHIQALPRAFRLALEMALHEEEERRALEGELKALEAAWRRAEEIAAISDDLLLPEGVEEFLDEHGKERNLEGSS